MLYKLSVSNIKKSFKDYAIYFVTLILGVCIFYIFNSIDSQTAMLAISERQDEIIELLVQLLSYVSVFVSCILGFLIIYASRFLIKKRKKEFGIYMILGMSKRKISLLLLIETFLIGLISLAVGLLVGIALSQITSIFIANLFEADMTKFTFSFSKDATIKTMLYFGIIYFIVMIFNTIIISKNKLINLLQASKKQEIIKIKNPIVCIILFVISVIMLGAAYYMVTKGFTELTRRSVRILLLPVSLGGIGTILFFYSAAGMILKILSRCHKLYYNNLNTFVFKQISSKINTMVISISIICLMLFFTLCLLSSAFTITNYFNKSINKYAPVDFQLIGYYDDELKNFNLKEFVENDGIIKDNTKGITVVYNYHDDNFTYGASLGNYENEVRKKYPYVRFDAKVEIMSKSDFNKMAEIMNFEKVNLNKDEYAIVSNYEVDIYKEVVRRNSTLQIFNSELRPYKDVIDGFDLISANPSNIGFFVVDDSLVEGKQKNKQILVGNYSTDNKEIVEYIDNKVQNYNPNFLVMTETKNDIKQAAVGLSVIVTFIGLYLGIIFLISSSAILALKELSDCIDDKNKYKTLRQIGADEKDINKALFKQTLIFFMMPLSLAVVHTIFGIKFCKNILNTLGIDNMLNGSIITILFLIAIYGIYFVITYLCSRNIIKE